MGDSPSNHQISFFVLAENNKFHINCSNFMIKTKIVNGFRSFKSITEHILISRFLLKITLAIYFSFKNDINSDQQLL